MPTQGDGNDYVLTGREVCSLSKRVADRRVLLHEIQSRHGQLAIYTKQCGELHGRCLNESVCPNDLLDEGEHACTLFGLLSYCVQNNHVFAAQRLC